MTHRSSLILAAVLTGLAVTARAADIAVDDPYVRAVPPGQPNSAAFMALKNNGGDGRSLVGAESPAADVVELHTHVNEGGVMKMRRIERIELPAGESVSLKPGGLHVMLIGLKQPLAEGDVVDVTLNYDDGSKELVKAPVRKIAMPPMKTH